MTLPATVRIGAVDYDVKLAHKEPVNPDDLVLGEIGYGKATIYIEPEQNPQIMRQTLLHEITHGILHQAGHYEDNEAIITALGYGLYALIRSNPALIGFIREDTHDHT